jgi:hypothetical protein
MEILRLQTDLAAAPEVVDFRPGCEIVGISARSGTSVQAISPGRSRTRRKRPRVRREVPNREM